MTIKRLIKGKCDILKLYFFVFFARRQKEKHWKQLRAWLPHNKISVDDAVAVILSQVDDVMAFKGNSERRPSLADDFLLHISTGFGVIKHIVHSVTQRGVPARVKCHCFKLFQTDSTGRRGKKNNWKSNQSTLTESEMEGSSNRLPKF